MVPRRNREGFVGVIALEDPEGEAKWVADEIQRMVGQNGGMRYSDLGVLMRSVSTAAEPLLDELTRGLQLHVVVCGPAGAELPELLRDAPGGVLSGGGDAAEGLRALLASAGRRAAGY
jgi:superfamily I DNA/RNA helicase